MKLELDASSLRDLTARLSKLDEKVQAKISRRAAAEGAKVLEDELKITAPRADVITRESHRQRRAKYGSLRDNITVTVRKQSGEQEWKARIHTGDAFWGLFLEYGTPRMEPKQWMRPAFDHKSQEMIEAVADSLKADIEREA